MMSMISVSSLQGSQDPENNCLTRENYCDHVTCHDGVCQELHGDFECLCYDGFTGKLNTVVNMGNPL